MLPETADILAIVKADAYGHGASRYASLLQDQGVTFFGVATVEEALELRASGITGRILLLGGAYGDYQACLDSELTPVLADPDSAIEWAAFLHRIGKSLVCHMKFDTGMGRLGFRHLEDVRALLRQCPEIKVEGIMTHLAVADEAAESSQQYTLDQLKAFVSIAEQMKVECPELQVIHCANSALILTQHIPKECRLLVRPGLSLYGVAPRGDLGKNLLPVLTWETAIHSVKTVEAGRAISYGRTFVTRRDSRIAVLPVGYADGYPRLLSNRAYVLVRGKRAAVVGRVCMDLTMIDVSDIPEACRGDKVVLLGAQENETLSVDQLAVWAETISYEIFCGISRRVRREYV